MPSAHCFQGRDPVNPYLADPFWLKARLFVNRAMEPGEVRSEDERRLWAALALEQLAKWALAETSPVLVVDPVSDGGSQLFKALGLQEGSKNVTAQAKTVFARCAQIYRPFDEREAMKIAGTRNEYLHGPDMDLLRLPDFVWWSKYWSLMNVLLTSHQRQIGDFVGPSRVSEVENHLAQNNQRIKEQYEAALGAAQRNLNRHESGIMTTSEKIRWDNRMMNDPLFLYAGPAECPACGAIGAVQSDYADSKEISWIDEGDGPARYPIVEVTFLPDYFSCRNCHLILDDYELVEQAGLNAPVTMETDEEPFAEGEYGND